MQILNMSRELSAAEVYKLTMSPEIQRMSDNLGAEIDVQAYCLYEDGEEPDIKTILSIMDVEGKVFATNSFTFQREFMRMNDLFNQMGCDLPVIKVCNGVSKSGRDFITCGMA